MLSLPPKQRTWTTSQGGCLERTGFARADRMPLLEAVGIFDLGTHNPLGHAGQHPTALFPNFLGLKKLYSPRKRSSETREDHLFQRRPFRPFSSTPASQEEGRWASWQELSCSQVLQRQVPHCGGSRAPAAWSINGAGSRQPSPASSLAATPPLHRSGGS